MGLREAIRRADKYIRNKRYRCLIPECTANAVICHSIPRSTIIEALAEGGVVYTQRQSLSSVLTNGELSGPADIVKVGASDASVFNGFCGAHDAKIFAPAEKTPLTKGGLVSLHVRAISLELCRKRHVLGYYRRLSELTNELDLKNVIADYELHCSVFHAAHLSPQPLESYGLVVTRNVEVSCCGAFGTMDSVVSYNVVSYADVSIVVLSTAKQSEGALRGYLANFSSPLDQGRLVNDLAFSRCEEPLISPRLWNSLNEQERKQVGVSLLPPPLRAGVPTPQIIQARSSAALTQAMKERVGLDKARQITLPDEL